MIRAYVWIVAVTLAVGPLVLVAGMRPATQAEPTGSRYVLTDGPVAASTDDVVAAAAEGGMVAAGYNGGTVGGSIVWTAVAGLVVLAAWGLMALGDATAGSRADGHAGGIGREVRRGWLGTWRFAVPGAARWESTDESRVSRATK